MPTGSNAYNSVKFTQFDKTDLSTPAPYNKSNTVKAPPSVGKYPPMALKLAKLPRSNRDN